MKQYIALIELDGKNCGVVFPDLPGCISVGDDYEDAVRMAHEALSLYADDNNDMPQNRTLKEIKKTWEDWEDWKDTDYAVAFITALPLRKQAKRVNIMIDEGLLASIDMVTTNRSAFLSDAARRMLEG